MTWFLKGVVVLMGLASWAEVQSIPPKNAIRLGIDYMSLDAPDDLGYRYLGRYTRYVGNDRIGLEASLGYLKIPNNRFIPGNYVFEGRPRKRITADLTASFDFIKSPQHAFRLGLGPSVWYREDDTWRRIDFDQQPGGGIKVSIENHQVNELNVGMHLMAEYEYETPNRMTIGGRFGMATFEKTGISSMMGLNLGYRF